MSDYHWRFHEAGFNSKRKVKLVFSVEKAMHEDYQDILKSGTKEELEISGHNINTAHLTCLLFILIGELITAQYVVVKIIEIVDENLNPHKLFIFVDDSDEEQHTSVMRLYY